MEAEPVSAKTWNLAEEVEIPPIRRSSVMFKGDRVPSFLCQKSAEARPRVPVESGRVQVWAPVSWAVVRVPV